MKLQIGYYYAIFNIAHPPTNYNTREYNNTSQSDINFAYRISPSLLRDTHTYTVSISMTDNDLSHKYNTHRHTTNSVVYNHHNGTQYQVEFSTQYSRTNEYVNFKRCIYDTVNN
jgi:hypothetical protein